MRFNDGHLARNQDEAWHERHINAVLDAQPFADKARRMAQGALAELIEAQPLPETVASLYVAAAGDWRRAEAYGRDGDAGEAQYHRQMSKRCNQRADRLRQVWRNTLARHLGAAVKAALEDA